MLTYITNISSRSEKLFANSLKQEFGSKILFFDPENIYEIVWSNKPNFIILHDDDLNNYHVKKFMKDEQNFKLSTVFIILKSSNKKISLDYKNIQYIEPSQYLPYDEYSETEATVENFVLCDLECSDEQKNVILQPLIYPQNKQIPVKLVNCHKVGHIQNLGLVDEKTMLRLLSKCSLYINLNNSYVYDAMFMNKPILNLTDNPYIETVNEPTIENLLNKSINYKVDIAKNKISNIIKYIKSKYE